MANKMSAGRSGRISGLSFSFSVCGEPQPHPSGHEADTEEARNPDRQRPPRAWEPPEDHRRENSSPSPRKGQRRAPEGGHPAATVQEPQGAVAASSQAPLAAGPTTANQALGPEIQGPPYPPARARQSQEGQIPPGNRRGRASTHPSTQPRTSRTTNAPAAGGPIHRQGVWRGGIEPEMLFRVESRTQPDTCV
ncbi:proline-rich protein 2-like [Brienomyrus brachyistius]|uniref:proline-rich protein 2-like n=1 Tax=Brienomyrus brachyistius TaxID=42636 RepID=UPI0020B3D730|nr:proline-rich protein 2-like [Brienomyrus brachyistius]